MTGQSRFCTVIGMSRTGRGFTSTVGSVRTGRRLHRRRKVIKNILFLVNRRFYLVDIENIVGGVPECREQVGWAREALAQAIAPRPGDHLALGLSHASFVATATNWAGPKRILPPRSGRNGADHALLDVLHHENITARFSHVVLASGDGIFSESIAEIARAGVRTTIVARRRSLSRRLRVAAHEVLYLPDPPPFPDDFLPPTHQQSA